MTNLNKSITIKNINQEKTSKIQKQLNCSLITAQIISNRVNEDQIDSISQLINPKLQQCFPNTNLIPNIEKFQEKTKQLIQDKNNIIGIIGDYDVDGLTSTAMIIKFFEALNIKTEIWIPSRKDGYGPNKETAKFFNDKKINVVITLDCGTTCNEFSNQYKGDIIVIDHHPSNKIINNTENEVVNPNKKIIIINPNVEEFECTNHLLKELSAASLLFFCLKHIFDHLENEVPEFSIIKNMVSIDFKDESLDSLLDLVTLSTVCDMMPMNQLNKALIIEGLKVLNKKTRIGLAKLIDTAKIKSPITTRDIGFNIGPRLNAPGRIESPKLSLNLLLAKTEEETNETVAKIERTNNYRRELQIQIFSEAILEAKKINDQIICLKSNNWPLGVVGIIAAMIQNEVEKPTIIANIKDNIIKGSARSNTANIGSLIQEAVAKQYLESGGGHKAAGGFTCNQDQWQKFKEWINQQEIIANNESISIDAITTLEMLKNSNNDYKIIGPFGIGNQYPVVLIKNLIISKLINKGEYTILTLQENNFLYSFFLNNSKEQLIQTAKNAQYNKNKINVVFELNEKYHSILHILNEN